METIATLRRAVDLNPQSAAAAAALGSALFRRREIPDGVECLRKAASLAPDSVEHQFRLGNMLFLLGELDESIVPLEQALSLAPDDPRILSTLGAVYTTRQDPQRDARELFLRGMRLGASATDQAAFYFGVCRTFVRDGGTLHDLQRTVQKALRAQCTPAAATGALTHALMQFGRYEDALRCLHGLPEAQHQQPAALLVRAHLELALGDIEGATSTHERVHGRFPDDGEALVRYLLFLFKTGNVERARDIYRRQSTQRAIHPLDPGPAIARVSDSSDAAPAWAGSPVAGKIVLVRTTLRPPHPLWLCGYGDIVQFCRFGARMAKLGAGVFVETCEPLRELMNTMADVRGTVLPHDEPIPYHSHCDAFSALFLLDWDWPMADDIPFLHVPAEHVARWKGRLSPEPTLHVGLVWRSKWEWHSRDDPYTRKSIPAACLRALEQVPNVTFYNLYVGRPGDDEVATRSSPRPLSEGFTTFMDAAGAIRALDLVVSVDTAAAHLAGAVGTPCLLMLPRSCAWQWPDRGESCGWYPGSTIFRQPKAGDWASVLEAVRGEVANRAAAVVRQSAS